MWSTLKEFAGWYWDPTQEDALSQRIRVPHTPIKICDGSFELVLYREGQYQAELISLYANRMVPKHKHPNVASMDVHLAGTGEAVIAGRTMPAATLSGHALSTARRLTIPSKVLHWGYSDTDVVVISLQKWHNDVQPTFITDDWEGDAWR